MEIQTVLVFTYLRRKKKQSTPVIKKAFAIDRRINVHVFETSYQVKGTLKFLTGKLERLNFNII